MTGMIGLVLAAIAYIRAYALSRHRLALEVAALRQQLVVFKRKRPRPLLRKNRPTLLDYGPALVVRLG